MHVITHHLEMTDPSQLVPAGTPRRPFTLVRAEIPSPELSRFLYAAVGGDWFWLHRLEWSYERWLAYLSRPELETWVASVAGTPAGYFELEAQARGAVEMVYFGLLPQFIGEGLGGALLTDAVRRAWTIGARRVWLHTCNLDHPTALAHYQARGFRVFKVVESEEDLPERSPGPWPGARQRG
jgi:GNAT superfamily N-acetyltransferase